jgi:hypothetical protein
MFCGHRILQGDGPVYAEGPEEGERAMEIILRGAQHREMCEGIP